MNSFRSRRGTSNDLSTKPPIRILFPPKTAKNNNSEGEDSKEDEALRRIMLDYNVRQVLTAMEKSQHKQRMEYLLKQCESSRQETRNIDYDK